ncbi:MAG: hypothetical protein V7L14_07305 [Nostoc sp.]|uniref:hypothetical protein n=1 Tax=Nostoc sp. TaxID=1180 RepID=UPI002FFCCDE9
MGNSKPPMNAIRNFRLKFKRAIYQLNIFHRDCSNQIPTFIEVANRPLGLNFDFSKGKMPALQMN